MTRHFIFAMPGGIRIEIATPSCLSRVAQSEARLLEEADGSTGWSQLAAGLIVAFGSGTGEIHGLHPLCRNHSILSPDRCSLCRTEPGEGTLSG